MKTLMPIITENHMKKNVVIIEFLYHWDYFITHYKILSKKYNVYFIVGEEFKDKLTHNYNFSFDNLPHLTLNFFDHEKIELFIEKNNIEKIFMPTIQGFELTYQVSRLHTKAEFYFTIHNFDKWLAKTPFLDANGSKFIDEINTVYQSMCTDIIKKSAGILSIDQNVKDYIQNNYEVMNSKMYLMPWKTNQVKASQKELSDSSETIFTVPASVDGQRRNYGAVLETFKQIFVKYESVRLVLLGRPVGKYGDDVLSYCRSINKTLKRKAITYFDDFIHQKEYNYYLLKTDFFILPVFNKHVIGRYKASAAMYDALLAGRPVLVPHDLNFSGTFVNDFGDGFMVYEDLYETIDYLMNGMDKTTLSGIKSAAIENADYFLINNQITLL